MFAKIFQNSERGFTLLEILVSITILSIVMMGTMTLFTQAYQFSTTNNRTTIANNLATGALNYIQTQPFAGFQKKLAGNVTYITVTTNDCNATSQLFSPDEGEATPTYNTCKAVLSPTINGNSFSANDIKAYIFPYNTTAKDVTPALPTAIANALNNSKIQKNIDPSSLFRVIVSVEWDTRNKENVIVEGTIANEKIR